MRSHLHCLYACDFFTAEVLGVFGAVRGGLVVLLLSWLALWVDALRVTGTAEILPEISDSSAAAVTGTVVEAGVVAALSDSGPSSRVVARIAAHPGVALSEVQGLVEAGREAFGEERLDAALDYWRRALLIDPENERIQAYIARAERQLENLERLRETPRAEDAP